MAYFPEPVGYKKIETFPHFEVVEVISGGGTVAPNLGMSYTFSTEDEARGYISRLSRCTIQLTRWDRKNSAGTGFGETLESCLKIS
jgi:hypothetical protein